MKPPHPISSSTSNKLIIDAAPKCISESTSYLPVWLAFHPYPQVIRRLFNVNRFGPPLCVTKASTCPWVDHKVSRLIILTIALFRLGFPTAPILNILTSLVQLTRRLIMQKARRHTILVLRPLVGVWFQVLFHPSIRSAFHLSFTVLVHYRSFRSI